MPQEQAYREEYEQGTAVTDIFPVNNVGMQTHRDYFVTDIDGDKLRKRITDFRNSKDSEADIVKKYELGNTWNVSKAQSALRSDNQWEQHFVECLWRPFDIRPLYYNANLIDRPRRQITEPLLKPNLALLALRQLALDEKYTHFLVAKMPIIDRIFYSNRGAASVFPLWIYPTQQEAALGMEREANLAPTFVAEVKERIGDTPTPEDIFHYAYAVFHAPTYRTRYAAFLKTDFPRLPLPPDGETFYSLAALGAKLTALHLLEDSSLEQTGVAFPVPGDHVVKKMKTAARYIPTPPELGAGGQTSGRVKLNDTEYFDYVPPEAWEFRVGGYQPAAKWLEDRAGRTLTADDITHYRRMIAAMRETAALLPQVDATFSELLAKNAEHLAETPKEE